MLIRLTHTAQGFALGTLLTLAGCGYLYLSTHDVKFTSTATNQPPAVVTAQAIENLMPLPEKKPNVKR